MYYAAWYKNGVLIYKEDLATPSVQTGPPQGITVNSNYAMMMSTLTIDNAALDDSGSYTCAVSCEAWRGNFSEITANLRNTSDVFVYGKCYSVNSFIPSTASEQQGRQYIVNLFSLTF